MGLDFFRRAVELQRRYAPPDLRVTNALQTNGTRLTPEWGPFLRDEGFLVGISIDGPAELHDRYRRDSRGRGSLERALRGFLDRPRLLRIEVTDGKGARRWPWVGVIFCVRE